MYFLFFVEKISDTNCSEKFDPSSIYLLWANIETKVSIRLQKYFSSIQKYR